MKKTIFLAAAGILCLGIIANAQVVNAGGSLALTGTVEGSILLTFHQNTGGGITLGGDGTSSASAALTTVSMYGTPDGAFAAGANFVKSTTPGTGFTMTGTYNVKVEKANTSSDNYDLLAALNASDANYGWTVNGQTLGTVAVTVSTAQTYGSQTLQTLVISVPATSNAASVSNSIIYSVTPH